ncbi:MAG TPA: AMP-binding protein, partial [Anaerolineae bacterium]
GGESMVGLLITTLPVRVRVPPDVSVRKWLHELRARSLAVRPHEHTPLAQVQEWSEVPRSAPLFEHLLVFENYLLNDALQALGGGWQKRECEVLAQPSYPLTLVGYASLPMLLRLRFDPERFEAAIIKRMFEHLQTLLQSMIEKPEQPLAEVSLLTEAEQHQQLVAWNETRRDYPHDRCFHELFEAQVERTPGAMAVAYQEERLTYRELNRQANRLAHHLRKLGVGPETIVGICPQRRPEMMIGLLAIFKSGGAYLPLDPDFPAERLTFMLSDARAAIVLTQQRWADRFTNQCAHVICLDTDLEFGTTQDEANPISGVRADNLAYVIYTSGSTGKPKGTLVPHRGLVNYLTWCAEAYAVADGRGAPVHSSIGFDLTITGLFAPLLAGQRVILVPEDEEYEGLV